MARPNSQIIQRKNIVAQFNKSVETIVIVISPIVIISNFNKDLALNPSSTCKCLENIRTADRL